MSVETQERRRLEGAADLARGDRPGVVARRYGVSLTTIYRWRERVASGTLLAQKGGPKGPRRKRKCQ